MKRFLFIIMISTVCSIFSFAVTEQDLSILANPKDEIANSFKSAFRAPLTGKYIDGVLVLKANSSMLVELAIKDASGDVVAADIAYITPGQETKFDVSFLKDGDYDLDFTIGTVSYYSSFYHEAE